MGIIKDHGDEELYDKLDSAYATEDDHSEVCISCFSLTVVSLSFFWWKESKAKVTYAFG